MYAIRVEKSSIYVSLLTYIEDLETRPYMSISERRELCEWRGIAKQSDDSIHKLVTYTEDFKNINLFL